MPVNIEREEVEEDDEVGELADWLGKAAAKIPDDDGGTVVITGPGADGAFTVIDEIDVSEDVGTLEALSQKIYDVAAKDAHGIGGGSYFVTMKGAQGRFPIVFEAKESRLMERSEPMGPSRFGMGPGGPPGRVPVEGWVKMHEQTLKHNEFLFDATIRDRADMFKLMRTTIQELTETVRFHERERAKERVLIEELQSSKHLRDLELEKMKKAEERKDEALGLLKPWAHSVGARLLGPKSVPKDVVPLLEQFDAVFSTFTQEQFAELSTTGKLELTPRQKQEIIGLFSTLLSLKEQAEAQKKESSTKANGQA